MMILSMDLGKFNTVCCLYDTRNRKYRFETIATKRSHVDHLLESHHADLVVMEACGPSGWICDVSRSQGLRTIVCGTNDEAWSFKNVKRKTDRDDALKLAKMASMEAFTSLSQSCVKVEECVASRPQESSTKAPPTLMEMTKIVAELGGYINRKNTGPPGPQSMWLGLQQMHIMATCWLAFGPGANQRCV